MASLRAILASLEDACWILILVEFEMAYSMHSFRVIGFEDSWAREVTWNPRVITKYTQIKAIKRVFLVISELYIYTFAPKDDIFRAIEAKALFVNNFQKYDECKKCKGLYTFL